jgi:hypothetical protein
MIRYRNLRQQSSVLAYDYGDDWIKVEFDSGDICIYTYEAVGRQNVEAMKKCAHKGKGLESYLAMNIQKMMQKKKKE